MDKTGWTAHCFGHFLIDLPPDVVINAGYYPWGDNIQRLDGIPAKLAARIVHRKQELRNGIHKKIKESMFVRKAEDKAGTISLWSWDSNASLLPYRVDSYFVVHPKGEVFLYSGEVTHDKEKEGEEAVSDMSRSLHSREPEETPTEPGSCIDRAYIAGDSFQDEEFGVGVTLPNHLDARFEFRSPTGFELSSLLERVDGFVQNMPATAAGIERLGKRKHLAGSLPGEEHLVAGNNKGQRAYTFVWEVQGKEESLTEPNLTAGLAVLERNNENGKPSPPAFKSGKEALELWDAIVGSIRVRPTSSSPRDGSAGPSLTLRPATPGGQTLDDDHVYKEFPSDLKPKDSWLDDLQEQPAIDIIRFGDITSHGGTAIEAFGRTDPNGKSMAGVGHQVICPLRKKTLPITEGNALLGVNGVPVALHEMKIACGVSPIASGPLGAAEN